MAVTVVKTPSGHKIIDQAVEATVTNSIGDALITFPYHGLGTGDFIYITADIEEYSGFWYVTAIDSNSFKISEYGGADFVGYEQDADLSYYQTTEHVWSSIFLPIIYKISNDLWPTNSVDTIRTVSSYTNDNGYTNLNLSGALKASFQALEYVKITNGAHESLNGVWQIVEVVNTSDITISLPFPIYSLTGASIQYYYNNYQVKVKVYGGLPTTHPWYMKKPSVEVAELSLTPDEDNVVMFSVSDYIKGKVAIKNNPTIGSYPLNLDAFTGFQISTGESFDQSDNYTLFTDESDFTDDPFEGFAVAGKLPFKNTYAGDYSQYIYTSGSPADWLTVFPRLFAVEDLYFDISFIKTIVGDFTVHIDKYVSDYLTATEDIPYTDRGLGVYRIPIEVNSIYDSFCVSIIRDATTGFTPVAMDPIDTWSNVNTGGVDWAIVGSTPEFDPNSLGAATHSNDWHTDYAFEVGRIYALGYTFLDNIGCSIFHLEIVDASNNVLSFITVDLTFLSDIPVSGTYSFTAPIGAAGINIWVDSPCSCGSPSDGCVKSIQAFTNTTSATNPEDAVYLTEEICIDILESCTAVAGGGTPDEDFFRLLETGFFRLLETGDRRLLEEAP